MRTGYSYPIGEHTVNSSVSPASQRTDVSSILRNYSTEEAAAILKVRPQTLRAALCRDGAYFGVRPFKSRSRFLLWPADAIQRLAAGEVA